MAIIDPVMWWFKIMQYNENKYITIVNLVETTCLTRYPWTIEITCDQGSYLIGH